MINNDCVPAQNGSYCAGCQTVVAYLSMKGCDASCSLLPAPADVICKVMVELGLCTSIIDWVENDGLSPYAICSATGFCSASSCPCSYCTRYTFSRCLSLPHHCPASDFTVASPDPITTKYPSKSPQFCIDKICSPEYEGCCLSCF